MIAFPALRTRIALVRCASHVRVFTYSISALKAHWKEEVAPPLSASPSKTFPAAKRVTDGGWALAAHGGAGTISDTESIPIRMKEFSDAFAYGQKMLQDGALAVDAVQEVVARLENSPYFNAGKGSVFTNAGTHEMDASIMDGSTGTAGAVAMVSNIKNPIYLARTVASSTQHVLLCGAGASSLAPEHGIEMEDSHYFFTEERYAQLKNARLHNSILLDHDGEVKEVLNIHRFIHAYDIHTTHVHGYNICVWRISTKIRDITI